MQNFSQPAFSKLSHNDRKSALEALIFSSEEPLSSKHILNMLINIEFSIPSSNERSTQDVDNTSIKEIYIPEESEFNENYFNKLIDEINQDLASTGRSFRIVHVGGGWQYAILPEFGQLIHQSFKIKIKKKFSQAALETLAVIAYKQPVSKPEIEQIRGVNSNEVVNSLIEKNLVKIAGRSESLGKPLLYATTSEFLRVFGINSLEDLPKLKELEEISPAKPDEIEDTHLLTITIDDNPMQSAEATIMNDEQVINLNESDIYGIELKSEFIEK